MKPLKQLIFTILFLAILFGLAYVQKRCKRDKPKPYMEGWTVSNIPKK